MKLLMRHMKMKECVCVRFCWEDSDLVDIEIELRIHLSRKPEVNMVKKKRNLQRMEIRWKKTAGTRQKVGNLKKGSQRIKVYSSSSLRNRLVNLCPELYRSGITRMLFNDLILLRIMSCDYKLLLSEVSKFGWVDSRRK